MDVTNGEATSVERLIDSKRSSLESLLDESSKQYDFHTTSDDHFLELFEASLEPVSSFTQESSPKANAPQDKERETSTPSWIEQQFMAEFDRNSSSFCVTDSCDDIFAIESTADVKRLNSEQELQQYNVDHIEKELQKDEKLMQRTIKSNAKLDNPTEMPGCSQDDKRAPEMPTTNLVSPTKPSERGECTPKITTLETITVSDFRPRSQDDDTVTVMEEQRPECEVLIHTDYLTSFPWHPEPGHQLTIPVEENHEQAEEHSPVPASAPNDETALKHAQLRCRINALLQHIEQHVCEGVPLVVKQKLNWDNCTIEEGILQPTAATLESTKLKRIKQERLQLIIRTLATVHQLLTTGTSCTKRELYYLNFDLVSSPARYYAALDDVCALLDVQPSELNVFNTSKGLIAGPLLLTLAGGKKIDCSSRRSGGTAVPMDVNSITGVQSTAKAVLVVEKDTVFKRLLEDGLMSKSANSVLLITAKGYPDVSTRLLLRKIVDTLGLPVYALVDADPHGIEIFCVYKFGSLAMAHRPLSLAIPTIQWIGLFPSEIELLGLHSIPLRDGELRKIDLMIERPYASGLIKKELLIQRQLAVKTEIESLFHIASDYIITVYLKQKLKECSIGIDA